MSTLRPTLRLPVDARNPGEFLACCGLLELADHLGAGSEGWFDENGFNLLASRTDPVKDEPTVLAALAGCAFDGVFPERAELDNLKQLKKQRARDGDKLSADEEARLDALDGRRKSVPVRLTAPVDLQLDWWLDYEGMSNRWKMWAGQQSTQGIFDRIREGLAVQHRQHQAGPPAGLLACTVPMSGSLGFDARSAWRALDLGFSPNEHSGKNSDITVRGSPALDLLACLGMQRFRPTVQRLWVFYSTWCQPLPPAVASAAAAGALPGVQLRRYKTRFVKRGQNTGLDLATELRGAPDE